MFVEIEPLIAKAKSVAGTTPFAASLIIREMEKAKSVDVAEVVRCKDCGSYNQHYDECTRNGSHLGENGYCSNGKRK